MEKYKSKSQSVQDELTSSKTRTNYKTQQNSSQRMSEKFGVSAIEDRDQFAKKNGLENDLNANKNLDAKEDGLSER